MKRMLTVLVVLVAVAGISFAQVELGGSTAAAASANADEQKLMIDQEVDIDIGALHFDMNAGYDRTFHDNTGVYDWLFGANYTMGIFKFGASLSGKKKPTFNEVKAFVDIAYEDVGADVDFLFSADPDKDAVFQGAEFSGFFNPGPLEMRLGYSLVPKDGKNIDKNTPEDLADGGLFGKVKISY